MKMKRMHLLSLFIAAGVAATVAIAATAEAAPHKFNWATVDQQQ